jgi:beta-lactamase regulating signal transducer with metallopeptidase domain
VITQLLAWLINATVATSVATLAILLLRKPLQRWLGAQIAYRLWIALPLATIAACFSLPHADPAMVLPAQAAPATASAVVVQVTQTLRSVDADRWLLAVWLLGAFALVLVFAWQQRRFVARLRLRERGDGSWRSATDDASPAVLGVLRQKLVLPERFETDYSDDEQRLVLAHERMHQQRRDPWALAACASLRSVFWFNPLLHVAAKSFRRDVELACDAAVLRAHPGSIRRYADALLKTHLAGHALPVGCLWHDTPPMKERIMLLKNALPARSARLAGAILVCLAACGATGLALAGHDTATAAAGALAAVTAPVAKAPAYQVKLVMSVDGKAIGHPIVVTRAGETAMIKLDENGVVWGFRFNVQPLGNGRVALTGDVVSGSDNHVIGHSHLEETAGGPMEIAIQNGGRKFNINARIAVTDHLARMSPPEMLEESASAPGERREVRIVTGKPGDLTDSGRLDTGTPAPVARREVRIVTGNAGDLPDGDRIDIDDGMPEDPAMAGAHREVRETRKCSPPDAQGHKKCKVTREVTVTAPGDAAPMAPLPPLPPAAGTSAPVAPVAPVPPRARRPIAMSAPPAPPVPPAPMALHTPMAPPALPALPTPMAMRAPPAPPAPPAPMGLRQPIAPPAPPPLPTPMAMRAPPAPAAPPAPMRLARASHAPVAVPAAPTPPAPPAMESAAPLPPAPPATPEPSAVPEPPEPASN